MVFAVVAMRSMRSTVAPQQVVRAFSTSLAARKDIVQEAYLRELKAYKAPAKSADAHKGQVRDYQAPKAPQTPSAPSSSELGSELESFAKSEPDHAEHSASSGADASAAPEHRQDVNAFLEEARKPYEAEAHH